MIFMDRSWTTRAALLLLTIATLGIASPARSADEAEPKLVGSSIETGWASVTRIVRAPAWDPTDPPAFRSDGVIEFIATRWDTTLLNDITRSFMTVTDVDGDVVPGKTLFDIVPGYTGGTYNYNRYAPYKGFPQLVMTFLFGQDLGGGFVVDHLKAGGAPYTATLTATGRKFNGAPGDPVTVTQSFGIDRRLPESPKLTAPEVAYRTGPIGCSAADKQTLGPASFVCGFFNQGKGYDSTSVVLHQMGDPLTVEGTVGDPLTAPWEEDPQYGNLETSGIAAVVIRLWCGSPFPCIGGSTFKKAYVLPQPCSLTHPLNSSIPRCPSQANFSVNLRPDLSPGFWYSFDVFAIDLAGYHRVLKSTDKDKGVENLAGPETETVAFYYAG